MAQIGKNFEDYQVLLGGSSMDAAAGSLFEAMKKVKVNIEQRAMLIGIGGAGINTINYIRGLMGERMDGIWKNHIGFLAIDSNNEMLGSLKYITDNNMKVCTTRKGVAERMEDIRSMAPAARRSMNPPLKNAPWNAPGAGQKRLMGRAKLHDQEPGGKAVDVEITKKIHSIWQGLEGTANTSTDVIYVICSICGGTGCGSITEMPALVRKALGIERSNNTKIYAIILTPDAMTGNMPSDVGNAANANAYAALKEVNYYQGVVAREQDITFPYNDAAAPDINLKYYYDKIILVGSPEGPYAGADVRAEQTIAEYLINQFAESQPISGEGLGKGETVGSVLVNPKGSTNKSYITLPGNENLEGLGEAHEFPQDYACIGFAKANAPYKIVKSYAVNRVCKLMGIHTSVSADGNPVKGGLAPFRGNAYTAAEGTLQADQLTAMFKDIHDLINSSNYDYNAHLHEETAVTFDGIKKGEYATDKSSQDFWIGTETNAVKMKELETEISKRYRKFLEAVTMFVKENGPAAFANVYYGSFIKDGENAGLGIQKRFENLRAGLTMKGMPVGYTSVIDAQNAYQHTNDAIVSGGRGLLDPLFKGRELKTLAASWVADSEKCVNAKVNEKRREVSLGDDKYIDLHILKKADILAEQLQKLGFLLDGLDDIYSGFGNKMANFEEFAKSSDSVCEVNLAGMNKESYKWLLDQVNDQVVTLNLKQTRDKMIDEFMAAPMEWLDTANALAENMRTLKTPSMPISARTKFDEYIGSVIGDLNFKVSIKDIVLNWAGQGMDYTDIAQKMIGKLMIQSRPQFHGNTVNGTEVKMLVYPSVLEAAGGEASEFAKALKEAVDQNWMVFGSDDADGIMMYTLIHEMPIYRQEGLEDWEKQYLNRIEDYALGLHGLSPATRVVFDKEGTQSLTDRIPWKDFEDIAVSRGRRMADIKTPGAGGFVSHEGKCRIEIDKVLKRAEEYGIINYTRDNAGKYVCERVWFSDSVNWEFDPFSLTVDDDDFPTGKVIINSIMEYNDRELADYSKVIELKNNALLMSGHYDTEELARMYVPRILRAHVPMYLEILDSLERFDKGWSEAIDEFKRVVMLRRLPKLFARILMAGKVRLNSQGVWVYVQDNKKEKPLLNTKMLKFMKGQERKLAGEFTAYYLYQKLSSVLGDEGFIEAYEEAVDDIDEQIKSEDMEALTTQLENAMNLITPGVEKLIEMGADPEDLIDGPKKKAFSTAIGEFAPKTEDQDALISFYVKANEELSSED